MLTMLTMLTMLQTLQLSLVLGACGALITDACMQYQGPSLDFRYITSFPTTLWYSDTSYRQALVPMTVLHNVWEPAAMMSVIWAFIWFGFKMFRVPSRPAARRVRFAEADEIYEYDAEVAITEVEDELATVKVATTEVVPEVSAEETSSEVPAPATTKHRRRRGDKWRTGALPRRSPRIAKKPQSVESTAPVEVPENVSSQVTDEAEVAPTAEGTEINPPQGPEIQYTHGVGIWASTAVPILPPTSNDPVVFRTEPVPNRHLDRVFAAKNGGIGFATYKKHLGASRRVSRFQNVINADGTKVVGDYQKKRHEVTLEKNHFLIAHRHRGGVEERHNRPTNLNRRTPLDELSRAEYKQVVDAWCE